MPEYKTIIAVAAVSANVVMIHRNRKRIKQLKNTNTCLAASVVSLAAWSDYLAEKLDSNDIEVTEFDKIVSAIIK